MDNYKGVAGELLAMAEAVKRGYNVAKLAETGNSIGIGMYDFILDDGIKLSRVEVKTSDYRHHKKNKNNQKVTFGLRRHNGSSYGVDFFALVCLKINKIALISADMIKHKAHIVIYYKHYNYHKLPMNTLEISENLKKTTNQLALFDKEDE